MAVVGKVYIEKFERKIAEYNHSRPLPDYFKDLIGDKKEVVIAELGAGLLNTIGDKLDGVTVKVYPSDILAKEYLELFKEHSVIPYQEVEYQDMENLTYPNEMFDIVHCRNAIDHTPDLHKAISEMKRVCKKGGIVYLAHSPSQKKRFKGHHWHNIEEVLLPEFTTHQEGELIISTWRKI